MILPIHFHELGHLNRVFLAGFDQSDGLEREFRADVAQFKCIKPRLPRSGALLGTNQLDALISFIGFVQNPRYLVKTLTSIKAAIETPNPYMSMSRGSKVTPRASSPKY